MPRVKANGLEFEYDEHGPRDGPPVLLIMGFSFPMVAWARTAVQGLVDHGFRVIRFDNRDAGRSERLSQHGPADMGAIMAAIGAGKPFDGAAYTLKDMADDAAAILAALGIDKAHIVGVSMGASIAQLFAIHHPEKSITVTAYMGTPSAPGDPSIPPADPSLTGLLLAPAPSMSTEDQIATRLALLRPINSPGGPASDEQLLAAATEHIAWAPMDPAAASRHLAATVATPSRIEALAGVRVPFLVLHGADDPLVHPAAGEVTARAVPGSKLVMIPGLSHDVVSDWANGQMVRHVTEFIKSAA
ncbi:putative hydrolase [Hyaloraphidium curvatum]|nr:putative hydrolase [Hyaloraphidium curvatum]